MAASVITEKARINLPLAMAVALLAGTVGGVVTAFSVRDQMLADMRSTVRAAVSEEREARVESLSRYPTREDLMTLTQRIEGRIIRLEVIMERSRR